MDEFRYLYIIRILYYMSYLFRQKNSLHQAGKLALYHSVAVFRAYLLQNPKKFDVMFGRTK